MIDEELVNELIRHRNEVQNAFGWNVSLIKALDTAIEALKAEPCEDAVSRVSLLENVKVVKIDGKYQHVIFWNDIKALPPVTPKPLDSVLDKIRAEIDAESAKSFRYPNWERAKALEWALSIIDKYKAESEE